MKGTVYTAEFITTDDDDEKEPGTYITIRLDDHDAKIMAGKVEISYLPNSSQ